MDRIETVPSIKDLVKETVAVDHHALLDWISKTIHILVMLAIWDETKR